MDFEYTGSTGFPNYIWDSISNNNVEPRAPAFPKY